MLHQTSYLTDMTGPNRSRKFARPRQIAAYLANVLAAPTGYQLKTTATPRRDAIVLELTNSVTAAARLH